MAVEEFPPLGDADYRFVASLLYDRFGIQLGGHKRILVAGRLAKRVRQLGFSSFGEYLDFLRSDSSGNELSEFVNRLTTNHSFFYREKDHYEFLRAAVLEGIRARAESGGRPALRIWSAGCASGEEAYTLALVVRDFLGDDARRADLGILGTDISLASLRTAQAGVYAAQKVSEAPPAIRSAYFREVGENQLEISPEIRSMVLFKRLNLMAEGFPFKAAFDVVFCRNVMIYFDQESRSRLVHSFFSWVRPGGYFFIGHSESIPRADCPFEYVRPAVYRRAG